MLGIPGLVSAEYLAEFVGVNKTVIHELVRRGIIEKASRGKYDFQSSIRRMYAQKAAVAGGRSSNAGLNLTAERARLIKAQADGQIVKNEKEDGTLIKAIEAERKWAGEMVKMRAALLAFPSGLAQVLSHLTAHDILAIDRALRDTMLEASGVDEPD